jgi:hypothetical protein
MTTLTSAFLAWVLTAIDTEFTYIAIGSDDTAESASHTALQAEISTNGGSRASATGSIDAGVLTISHEFTITGNLTVNEAGVFNASSNGTMATRGIADAPITLVNGDYLVVEFEFETADGTV